MKKYLAVTRHKLDNESVETNTSESQNEVEKKIEKLFELFCSKAKCDPEVPIFYKQNHINYIKNHMFTLPENYECLDSSRPWLCYWLCQSLALLNCKLSVSEKSNVVSFLSKYAITIYFNRSLNNVCQLKFLGVNMNLADFVVDQIKCHTWLLHMQLSALCV